jgi:AraC family transcriptional regulator of adaptative response/methylated-DNA-[protein]-cysteine methyltransferase
VLGVTPTEFARAQRVTHFRNSLSPASLNPGALKPAAASRRAPASAPPRITDAIYQAGFGSSSRLYESSASSLGMTPRTLRAGGAGAAIRYTTARSPLGRILIAATDLGVCAIAFGRNDAELLADLRARFPRAELKPAMPAKGWLAAAVAFVLSQTTEHPLAADFPLDVRATAFQHRVWKALQQIPRGQTRSYSQIARAIGRPTAMRAVGAAIGANPVAVVVPCHRVIGSDGSLTGYHWGLDRKRKLLAAEGTLRPGPVSNREP